ncbi:MAG: hypothetical protein ACR2OU_15065 [Thermomicrobiales bacterium]
MSLISWLRRDDTFDLDENAIDVEHVLAEGLRDGVSARMAIDQLKQEKRHLARQLRAVDAQFKRLTSVEVRNIGRAGPTQLTTIQLAQAMQDQSDSSQAGMQREEQIATIEARSQAVDRALLELEMFIRSRPSRDR